MFKVKYFDEIYIFHLINVVTKEEFDRIKYEVE